jgi:hypothetical protein
MLTKKRMKKRMNFPLLIGRSHVIWNNECKGQVDAPPNIPQQLAAQALGMPVRIHAYTDSYHSQLIMLQR